MDRRRHTFEEVEEVLHDMGVFDGDMTSRERGAFPDMLRHWIRRARIIKFEVSITQAVMNGGIVAGIIGVWHPWTH